MDLSHLLQPKLETPDDSPNPSPNPNPSLLKTLTLTPPLPSPNPNPPPLPPNLSDEHRHLAAFLLSFPPTPPNPKPNPSPRKRKPQSRSPDLQRVSFITPDELIRQRGLVRQARIAFESIRTHLLQIEDQSSIPPGKRSRCDLNASALMKKSNLWLNRDRRTVGFIPGIEIGDIFFYRIELCVLGLHGQVQAGIDFIPASTSPNLEPIATSVIFSGGYEDNEDHGDVLVYTGHGGRELRRNNVKQIVDQKLEGSNLALERSCFYGIEIRVFRGLDCGQSPTSRVYVYDGLYRVVECWKEIGKSGFAVCKFKLVRLEGQEEMGSSVMSLARVLKEDPIRVRPDGYLSLDLSQGEEKEPVAVFNDIDDDQDPLNFEYLARPKFHSSVKGLRGTGCQCGSDCSVGCECINGHGGESVYDSNGRLMRGKGLVYECGKYCVCTLSCINRVSQKGLRHRLELFKSRDDGWAVRSPNLIRAGEFVCEFSGILFKKQLSMAVTAKDGASLVDPNQFPRRWQEWGDVSMVGLDCEKREFANSQDVGYLIDVSRERNVGCYLRHSRNPNVFVQFVLFDHYNAVYPHMMIYAMENIPPMRELTLDYGSEYV